MFIPLTAFSKLSLLSFLLPIITAIFFTNFIANASPITSSNIEKTIPNGPTYIGSQLIFTGKKYDWIEALTKKVNVFRKIPYAKPPIGDLRFSKPEPIVNQRGKIDARQNPPFCVQPMEAADPKRVTWDHDEDCLYLSVYSPEIKSNMKLAVMVFVHGGSYLMNGAWIYDGASLSRYGVVVVVINYRLGILGFMTNGRDSMAGNYGLLDMVLALKWVNSYISHFGGDPNQVTLFGNSAGGSAVGIISVLPSAKGLITQTIEMSGPPAGFFSIYRLADSDDAFSNAFDRLCEILECPKPKESSKPWQNFSTDNITFDEKLSQLLGNANGAFWRVRVDGDLVPDDPVSLFSKGKFIIKRYMTGVTSNEAPHFVELKPPSLKELYTAIDEMLSYPFLEQAGEFHMTYTNWSLPENNQEYAMMISHAHSMLPSETSERTRKFNAQSYLDFLNDYIMRSGTIQAAIMATSQRDSFSGLPTFIYEFAYSPDNPSYPYKGGPHHEVDLDFLFGAPFKNSSEITGYVDATPMGMAVSRLYMTLFANFAKFGEPIWAPKESTKNYQVFFCDTYSKSNPQIIRVDENGIRITDGFERFSSKTLLDFWMKKLYVLQKEEN